MSKSKYQNFRPKVDTTLSTSVSGNLGNRSVTVTKTDKTFNGKVIKTSVYSKSRLSGGSIILRVLSIFFVFLLLINFAHMLVNGTYVTFTALLNWLSSVESMPIQINISSFAIPGDWGLFDFLRNFFNIFTNVFGVIVYMCSNLINLIIFISQFLWFLLG